MPPGAPFSAPAQKAPSPEPLLRGPRLRLCHPPDGAFLALEVDECLNALVRRRPGAQPPHSAEMATRPRPRFAAPGVARGAASPADWTAASASAPRDPAEALPAPAPLGAAPPQGSPHPGASAHGPPLLGCPRPSQPPPWPYSHPGLSTDAPGPTLIARAGPTLIAQAGPTLICQASPPLRHGRPPSCPSPWPQPPPTALRPPPTPIPRPR
mmetsp:Transcript_27988/g.66465  ORF Transcript_27988/g.66465 Transcript_27988/m.66465 type:complete len:211 (+) Transcript_27988:781-1413(+)